MLIEFDSVGRRDRLFPPDDQPSAEAAAHLGVEAVRRYLERWTALGSLPGHAGTVYTDYTIIGQ